MTRPLNPRLTLSPPALEVILSVLLVAFSFELTDEEIVWTVGAVSFPTMGLASTKPQMLLRAKSL